MSFRHSFFTNFLMILFAILIPIVMLYAYSNRLSTKIVAENIDSSTLSRMSYLLNQIDSRMEQLKMNTMSLIEDNDIRMFKNINELSTYEQVVLRGRIIEKLNLQIMASSWPYTIMLYSPESGASLSVTDPQTVAFEPLQESLFNRWHYANGQFSHSFSDSFSASQSARLTLNIALPKSNISRMLDQFKDNGDGDPFLYSAAGDVIVNQTQNQVSVNTILGALPKTALGDKGKLDVQINDSQYVAYYSKSEIGDWYLIDYAPLEEVLEPINQSMRMFYLTISLLILMAVISIYYLYMKVNLPIKELIKQMLRLKRGDYKARIDKKYPNEFGLITTRFNEMSEQIQRLIEEVYLHELRYRDAVMKQLQSQINPHFLYNCFYFITRMAKLGENDAIVAMSVNLGDYYRYTTRVENQIVTLEDEIRLVHNYLGIQKMRMSRMTYEINVPDEMLAISLPRLIVQPIVENAIIHGLEPTPGSVKLTINGQIAEDRYLLCIEDNGIGMNDEELERLIAKLSVPMDHLSGCGLWNVNQRVKHHFGEPAGLIVERPNGNGLQITIYWHKEITGQKENAHV